MFFHFAVKAAHYGFIKGVCGMPFVGRFSFKSPVAVRASEDKLGFSHNIAST